MADRKLMEEYENSLMSLAVSEMLEKMGKELEEEYKNMEDIPPDPDAGKKFYKAIDREYKKGRRRAFGKKAAKFGRYAVTVCAAVIVAVSISVVSVDALRVKFLDWLANIRPTHTTYNDIDYYNDSVFPEYMTSGYSLQFYSKDNSIITETFINNNNYIISILINTDNTVFNSDNEATDSELIEINQNIAMYTERDESKSLMWNDDKASYVISSNDPELSKAELVEIAQTLK